MIPQSISFIFFLMASVLSPMVFLGGYFMQHLQPNNKWFYVVYVAASALAVLAGVFLYLSGFRVSFEMFFV